MGFKLRREVRDRLPPGLLTASERCLVLEAADACDDDSREGFPGVEWLAEKADIPESKVGETFNKIGKKWLELRVPLGVGKDGRPYYSRPRKRTTYRFPATEVLDEVKATQSRGSNKVPETRGPKVPESRGPEVPQNRGTRSPKTGGPSPHGSPQQDSSKNTSPLSPVANGVGTSGEPQPREREADFSDQKFPSNDHRILAKYGWTGTNADALVRLLRERYDIWGPGWMIAADKNGTLPERIQELVDERLDELPDWTGPRPTNGRWPAAA